MSKPEWGTKRACQSCGAHFYDMRKTKIVCPKCGTPYDAEALAKKQRRQPDKPAPAKAPAADDLDLPEVEGGSEEEDVIEDTSELGEDDEDISDAIEPGEEEDR